MGENEISIADLRKIIDSIFQYIDSQVGNASIRIAPFLYWDVSDEARYNMNQTPSRLDCGSLDDDWEFLRPLLHHKEQALPIMFIHVAPILQYLATRLPNYPDPDRKDVCSSA